MKAEHALSFGFLLYNNGVKTLKKFTDSCSFIFQAITVMTSSFWEYGVEGLCTGSTLDQGLRPSSAIDLTTV